jgi:hypothetical protein
VYSLDNDTISDLKHTVSDLAREISVLEYSPDGAFLGVGSVGKDVTAYVTTDYQVITDLIHVILSINQLLESSSKRRS